jgi:hypothetical protein
MVSSDPCVVTIKKNEMIEDLILIRLGNIYNFIYQYCTYEIIKSCKNVCF